MVTFVNNKLKSSISFGFIILKISLKTYLEACNDLKIHVYIKILLNELCKKSFATEFGGYTFIPIHPHPDPHPGPT